MWATLAVKIFFLGPFLIYKIPGLNLYCKILWWRFIILDFVTFHLTSLAIQIHSQNLFSKILIPHLFHMISKTNFSIQYTVHNNKWYS